MKLILSEEQQFLKDTAQSFARDKTPVTHFRELRDSENAQCWDETIWKEMVELGWSGILVPEKFGGSDFGRHRRRAAQANRRLQRGTQGQSHGVDRCGGVS